MFGMAFVEIAIIVVFGLLLVLALLPGGGARDVADETIVHGVSAQTADQVLFRELSDGAGLPLVAAHAGSFTLVRSSRPGWTIAGALLLFPVGLLFLLISQEDRIQISVSEHPAGCRLRIVGRARRRDIDRVAATIHRVLPVPDIVLR